MDPSRIHGGTGEYGLPRPLCRRRVGELDDMNQSFDAMSSERRTGLTSLQRSPLHCAAKGNSPEVAALLISMGADTEARTAYKMTPLHVAAFYGSAAVIRYLLDEVNDLDINALDFGSCEEWIRASRSMRWYCTKA